MAGIHQLPYGGLDLGAIGRHSEPVERSWTARDAMLYALGIGAGQGGPDAELAFTTENSVGVRQRVLPTFALTLADLATAPIGEVSLAQMLHASEGITVHTELPLNGGTRAVTKVAAIYDKGKDALVTLETEVLDAAADTRYATITSGIFIRGAGGWGGERGASTPWEPPAGVPDLQRRYQTGPDQALIYRLSGDRNPLHSDPTTAEAAGFAKPILHGLCTYGYTGRALVEAVCDGEITRFGSMSARFSAPVYPGQGLTVSIWRTDTGARFSTSSDASVVLDRGVFELAGSGPG
jgi:acyl dehydratase